MESRHGSVCRFHYRNTVRSLTTIVTTELKKFDSAVKKELNDSYSEVKYGISVDVDSRVLKVCTNQGYCLEFTGSQPPCVTKPSALHNSVFLSCNNHILVPNWLEETQNVLNASNLNNTSINSIDTVIKLTEGTANIVSKGTHDVLSPSTTKCYPGFFRTYDCEFEKMPGDQCNVPSMVHLSYSTGSTLKPDFGVTFVTGAVMFISMK